MDVKQLRAFIAVANTQSFLNAADQLYISRQAISKSVTKLEEELGTRLFIRGQSGVTLTPAGTYLYHRGRILLADFDNLERDMKALDSGLKPSIKLCVSNGADSILSEKIRKCRNDHINEYDLEIVKCQDSDCDFVLTNLRAEAVISFSPLNKKSVITSTLIESPIVFLVNNNDPLAREPVIELSWRHRVSNFILYTGGRDHCLWWPVVPRPGDACSSDMEYLFRLLKEGKGIMPMPQAMVPDELPYATVLKGDPEVEPARLYFSTLIEKYYDPGTFRKLTHICRDLK